MKELYIITNNSKAGQYGIGTYITQLLYCLQTCIKIQVTVIMLDSQKDELVEKHIEGVRYLLLPTIQIHALEKDYRRYARSVAYVLASYLLLPYMAGGSIKKSFSALPHHTDLTLPAMVF